jgi:thioredoxin 1
MISRRTILAAVAAVPFASAAMAQAAGKQKFSQAAFAAAQAAGKPILVEVTAPWCPTCRAQKPIIQSLMAKPEFRTAAVFEVDFDSQKDAVRALGAQSQSTLIAFKGRTETGRSVGETNAGKIETLFKTAI